MNYPANSGDWKGEGFYFKGCLDSEMGQQKVSFPCQNNGLFQAVRTISFGTLRALRQAEWCIRTLGAARLPVPLGRGTGTDVAVGGMWVRVGEQ